MSFNSLDNDDDELEDDDDDDELEADDEVDDNNDELDIGFGLSDVIGLNNFSEYGFV
jgi:hypothetical protein